MNVRDFLSKNFANNVAVNVLVSPQRVTSTIARESWGDQLRTGRFQVPLDSTANTFTTVERTSTSEFAIYGTTDPINPLYQSSGDADGSKLRAAQPQGRTVRAIHHGRQQPIYRQPLLSGTIGQPMIDLLKLKYLAIGLILLVAALSLTTADSTAQAVKLTVTDVKALQVIEDMPLVVGKSTVSKVVLSCGRVLRPN